MYARVSQDCKIRHLRKDFVSSRGCQAVPGSHEVTPGALFAFNDTHVELDRSVASRLRAHRLNHGDEVFQVHEKELQSLSRVPCEKSLVKI